MWLPCSATCGEGVMIRSVHCVLAEDDGRFVKVKDSNCTARRPHDVKTCRASVECPAWVTGEWSEVEVTSTLHGIILPSCTSSAPSVAVKASSAGQ
jgi:hypothetical protein